MKPQPVIPSKLPSVNWLGLIAGVLMLVLPLLGPWWRASVGAGAVDIAFSPFDYRVSLLGKQISWMLVDYFLLAAKLSVVVGGVLLITGSLRPKRWWSRQLVRFGATKVLWMLIGLLLLMVVGALLANAILPKIVSGMFEGAEVLPNIPYVQGTATSEIRVMGMVITIPISISITGIFWVAVVSAAMGLAARIYHRRFFPKKSASG